MKNLFLILQSYICIHIILPLIIFIFTILNASYAEIQFLPDETLCKNPHGALLRSPSIDALYIHSEIDRKDYLGYNFGTKIPILSYDIDTIKSQFGGFGGIYTRFELFTYSFNFVNADFQGGVFNDFKYNRLSFEFMLYHVSSHLGDDFVNKENAAVTDTGFEAVRHYTTYAVWDLFEVTVGFEYKFSTRPDEKIIYNKSFLIGNRLDVLRKNTNYQYIIITDIQRWDISTIQRKASYWWDLHTGFSRVKTT